MQRFRGGLVLKAHRLCVSLNSRLESNEEEEKYFLRSGRAAGTSRKWLLKKWSSFLTTQKVVKHD